MAGGADLRHGSGFLVLTCGSAALLLAFYLLAAVAARLLGPPWNGLAMALDPARARSPVDLCGLVQLGMASASLLLASHVRGCPHLRLLALLPGVLLLADATDMISRLTALCRGGVLGPAAKLAAGTVIGGMALLPACLLWRSAREQHRSLAARLLCLLLPAGPVLLGLDAAGGWCHRLGMSGIVAHSLAVLEESGETLLYAVLTSTILGAVVEFGQESLDMRLYCRAGSSEKRRPSLGP
ncbi:hypothetical protein [Benzoatithermus flavus]|uniref:Uncharacterized protein n=1 Tax=Benzoatithermus flavus TaxID=3108223 RepID=A0ABU8XLJ5_9PROT